MAYQPAEECITSDIYINGETVRLVVWHQALFDHFGATQPYTEEKATELFVKHREEINSVAESIFARVPVSPIVVSSGDLKQR